MAENVKGAINAYQQNNVLELKIPTCVFLQWMYQWGAQRGEVDTGLPTTVAAIDTGGMATTIALGIAGRVIGL